MITSVTDYLDNTANVFPNKIAFFDRGHSLTFLQLKNEALHISTALLDAGRNRPVVVFLEKNVYCIVAFMGIAYSGNFYTPIDVTMPKERIDKIIHNLNPAAIITDRNYEHIAVGLSDTADVLVYEEIMQNNINENKCIERKKTMIDTDILYVLYTSGSTGTPKGVIINHRSVIDYTEWVTETFQIDNTHVFANQAPFYFDNSILDIYQTIRNGATMYIVPNELFSFPVPLLKYLKAIKASILFWVPSALCMLAHRNALEKTSLPELKKVLFCGEVMPNKELNIWRKNYPNVLFANLYGPTEITDACTYYIVDRKFNDDDPLPIGYPCHNTDILVLNESDELVQNGEIGELCVRGTSLALGYFNDIEKTNESFVQNPLQCQWQEKIYRTGDLVKYNEKGELIYICRKDFQIKHMGHRIELGEIEVTVNGIYGVDYCCCLYDEKNKRIVLFYTGTVDVSLISSKISAILPHYMLPEKIVNLLEMPMTLNGKIDRHMLKNKLQGV